MRGHDGKRPAGHPATSARDVLHARLQPLGPRPQRFPLHAQPCDLRAQPIHPCPQAKNSEAQGWKPWSAKVPDVERKGQTVGRNRKNLAANAERRRARRFGPCRCEIAGVGREDLKAGRKGRSLACNGLGVARKAWEARAWEFWGCCWSVHIPFRFERGSQRQGKLGIWKIVSDTFPPENMIVGDGFPRADHNRYMGCLSTL